MKWRKLGRIYNPEKFLRGGVFSYGANPFPILLNQHIYRIFYNIRDERNRSHITYLDFDIKTGAIIQVRSSPLISPGDPGLFDDSGCSLGCVLDQPDGKIYIYYVGWNLGVTVPWMNYIGLAVYDQATDRCEKYAKIPILDRNDTDYLSMSYPYVLHLNGTFHMWYGSNVRWGRNEKDMNHVIKYAKSDDGIHWDRQGQICIQGDGKKEYAFSRPSVLYEDGIYQMWYAYRGENYRIGYAWSFDGLQWQRRDEEAGIGVSKEGWDCEMVCYPSVFRYEGDVYMLHCGNGYGRTGFGLAIRE